MREITTLRNTNIYSNKISKELLPGIIKPLVWSVNIPVVNTSWKRLFMELIGNDAEKIDINKLSRSFYYRAYFNMGIIGDIFELLGIPRQSLEILAGIETPKEIDSSFKPNLKTIRYFPRICITALKKLFYSRRIESFRREREKEYRKLSSLDLSQMNEQAILDIIDRLFELNTDASYVVIVSQLLNSIYNRILKTQLSKYNIDYERLNFPEVKQKLFPIDPRQKLIVLQKAYQKLDPSTQKLIKEASLNEVLNKQDLGEFQKKLLDFVDCFGHLSDSENDFSTPTWNEDPRLILSMVTELQPSETQEFTNPEQDKLEAGLSKSWLLRMLYTRASKYREYRESVNFLYVYGYGLFRRFFKRIGQLLAKKELLDSVDDIFYLTYREIRSFVGNTSLSEELQSRIRKRKNDIERFKEVHLPDIIYNDLPESALSQRTVLRDMDGVATSKGHYIGPDRIVRGSSDFEKIQEGDVLVIPYSDVSWTPLFSKVAAVVSESGGILSHCSIVAREYGIPTVVSAKGAMDLVHGTPIAVDGYSGKVLIVKEGKL